MELSIMNYHFLKNQGILHASCCLTRIFHTDRDEEAAKADGAPPAVEDRGGDCPGFRGQP
jgi:hypothetical protein